MGQATSRTNPSIVTFDRFARDPSIDVFCVLDGPAMSAPAAANTNPPPAIAHTLKPRLIAPSALFTEREVTTSI